MSSSKALRLDEKEELTEFIFYHHTGIRPPSSVKHYTVTLLGKGGFGAAYRVRDYVIKILQLSYENLYASLQSEKAFLKEVKGWEDLSKIRKLKPFLPEYLGHSEYKYIPERGYMESIQGLTGEALYLQPGVKVYGCIFQRFEAVQPMDQTLTDMKIYRTIGASSKTSIGRAARLLIEETTAAKFLDNLIKAYTYMHEAGYIHRDIKPGNILVRTHEDSVHIPIVIDIGMLCELPCEETVLAGTPAYMPRNYFETFERNRTRRFTVNQGSGAGLAKQIREGLAKLIGVRLRKPIRSSKKIVGVKEPDPLQPYYNAHTDNYALAITMQKFCRLVDWKTPELKEHYEHVALRYIHSLAAFLAAAKKPMRNLTRNRKNASALRRLAAINEHSKGRLPPLSPLPPLPNSNSEEENEY